VNAVAIFLFGVTASIVAMVAICQFGSQVARNQSEKKCILGTYLNWVSARGSSEQKKKAQILFERHDVEGMKELVGTGMLVDE